VTVEEKDLKSGAYNFWCSLNIISRYV